MQIESVEVAFDGQILRRGFWVYVVEVTSANGRFISVGRTGDTSSPHAGSLFTRITTHLNQSKNAKGNSLLKCLVAQQLECVDCSYRFIGLGPIFEQQSSMELHCPLRDQMAALERAVADHLRGKGYHVVGDHPRSGAVPSELLTAVLEELDRKMSAAV